MSHLILASAGIREPLLNSPVGASLHLLSHGSKFPAEPCAQSNPDELTLTCTVELIDDASSYPAVDKPCSDEQGDSPLLQPQAKSGGSFMFAAGSRPNDQKKQTKPNVFFCLAKGSEYSGLVAWYVGKQAVACTEWPGKLNVSAGSFSESPRVEPKASWIRRRMAGYRYCQRTVRARMVRRRH